MPRHLLICREDRAALDSSRGTITIPPLNREEASSQKITIIMGIMGIMEEGSSEITMGAVEASLEGANLK